MSSISLDASKFHRRVREQFNSHVQTICAQQDRVLAGLLVVQFVFCVVFAILGTPYTWSGSERTTHPHIYFSILFGALITLPPLMLAWLSPGSVVTRHCLACAQMLYSSLLIHLLGGRLEAHFHIFGSLAFLAFYRDWKVLVTASGVVVFDHVLRGFLWPESIYGSSLASFGRTWEHGFWVVFENVFLIYSCFRSRAEMLEIAEQRVQLENEKAQVEERIEQRTQQLADYGRFLRGVIDGIDAGICILNQNGEIVASNSSWAEFDLETSDTYGAQRSVNYLRVFPALLNADPEASADIIDKIRAVLRGDLKSHIGEFSSTLGNELRWYQIRVSPVANSDSASAIVVHLDVTQRMQALADLQAQKEEVDRLALVAKSTTNGVVITDAEHRVIWVNDGFLRMQEIKATDVLGTGVEKWIITSRAPAELGVKIRHSMKNGRGMRYELQRTSLEGKTIVLDTELQPIIKNGKEVTGYIVVQNDHTELYALQDRVSSVFTAIAEGVLVQDSEGRIIDCNPEAERILGIRRSELMNECPTDQHWRAIFEDGSRWPMEDHPSMVTLRTGIPIRDAIMGIRSNQDTLRWISVNTQMIQGRGEASRAVVSSFTDVTSRREQLQRLDLTISGAGLGVWDWNVNTGAVRFNSIFAKMLGFTMDEIDPTHDFWQAMIHPQDRTKSSQLLQAHMQGESPDYRCEYRLKNKQGEWHWMLVAGRVVERDSMQRPMRMAGVHIDISTLKAMEQRIRESEKRMRQVFDTAMDAVVAMDAKGIVTEWNVQAEQIFGWKREEAVGKEFHRLVTQEETKTDVQQWLKTLADSDKKDVQGKRAEVQLVRKDRSGIAVELTMTAVQSEKGVGYSAFLRDITQQKELENKLAQAQRLESIGQLAAGVAHEINTPVQFVNDSVFFLREGVKDLFGLVDHLQLLIQSDLSGDPAELKEKALEVQEEADLEYLADNMPKAIDRSIDGLSRVAEIVRSMKEFAHQGSTEMKLVDINRAIQSTLIVAKNEYKYVADIETDLQELPPVLCHQGEVNQVFLNLIVNAAHAIEEKVRQTENRGLIRVSSKRKRDTVVISISDNGNGIPEKIQDRIYEPFFTTKEVGKGSGQGLAIAHNVIKTKHEGELRFETTVGKGTTFYIELPIEGPKHAEEEVEVNTP